MPRFVLPPVLKDSTNRPKQHDTDKQQDTNVKKPGRPQTPHPFKKLKANNDNKVPSDQELPALTAIISSPSPGRDPQDDDDIKNMEVDEQESNVSTTISNNDAAISTPAPHDPWKAFVDSLPNNDGAPNLTAYLAAKQRAETAKENLSTGLEHCFEGLNQVLTNDMLQDSVVSLHQTESSKCQSFEKNIVSTMTGNRTRRIQLCERLEQANGTWMHQYETLCAAVLRTEQPPPRPADLLQNSSNDNNAKLDEGHPTSSRGGGGGIMEGSRTTTDDHASVGGTQKDASTDNKADDDPSTTSSDPNWNDLEDFEPTRDNVGRFLEARDKAREADAALSHALDSIHEGLKADAEAILQVVLDCHQQQETKCTTLEEDIQYHILRNHKRRAGFHATVEASKKQAEGMFANLMSRLTGAGN